MKQLIEKAGRKTTGIVFLPAIVGATQAASYITQGRFTLALAAVLTGAIASAVLVGTVALAFYVAESFRR